MIETTLEVLFERSGCLVVNKPTGLPTQAVIGIDSLEVRVKDYLRRRDGREGEVYLGIPHRLDRPCTGAIVFAEDLRAARKLAKQFERRHVRKVYWACAEGKVEPEAGTWKDFVRKVPDEARAEVVPPDHPEARDAVLHYRVLQTMPWGSWLEIELGTGRMHQIRLQASTRGHPLLGDLVYGSRLPFGPQHEDWRLRPIALHARSLTFRLPITQETVTATAPPPEPWRALGLAISP